MSNKLDMLNTICFYAHMKKFSIKEALTIHPPADLSKMQSCYSLYFMSLLSLIEFIKERKLDSKIEDMCMKILGDRNNYFYIRELRNSIVHRGLDVSMAGTCIHNFVVPMSPVEVFDRQNKNSYKPFYDNLLQIIIYAEQLNNVFLDVMDKNNLFDYKEITQEEFEERKQNDPYIPQYVKDIKTNINIEDYNDELKKNKKNYAKDLFQTEHLFIINNEVAL